MITARLIGMAVLGSASLTSTAIAQHIQDGGRRFSTPMSGLEEVSGGDLDGTGNGIITINPGQRRVCWEFTVANILAPNRGHIHKAAAGSNGGIVVNFFNIMPFDETPAAPPLTGCTPETLDRALLIDIIQNPSDYYLNLHNAAHPGGAIRGQLEKK